MGLRVSPEGDQRVFGNLLHLGPRKKLATTIRPGLFPPILSSELNEKSLSTLGGPRLELLIGMES